MECSSFQLVWKRHLPCPFLTFLAPLRCARTLAQRPSIVSLYIFLLMATCCFSTTPVITYEWWCFCKISQEQRRLFGAAVWLMLKKECALFCWFTQIPSSCYKQSSKTYLGLFPSYGRVCAFVDLNTDVRIEYIWLIMVPLDTQTRYYFDPDQHVDSQICCLRSVEICKVKCGVINTQCKFIII